MTPAGALTYAETFRPAPRIDWTAEKKKKARLCAGYAEARLDRLAAVIGGRRLEQVLKAMCGMLALGSPLNLVQGTRRPALRGPRCAEKMDTAYPRCLLLYYLD